MKKGKLEEADGHMQQSWSDLPENILHKIFELLDEKTRCSTACLVSKEWLAAEREGSLRWKEYSVGIPNSIQHLLYFKRILEAGCLERLRLWLDLCAQARPSLPDSSSRMCSVEHYLSAAVGCGIKELVIDTNQYSSASLFANLLPSLTKLSIEVIVNREKIDVTSVISMLGGLKVDQLEDLSIKMMADHGLRGLERRVFSHVDGDVFHDGSAWICESLKFATKLTSLELLVPHDAGGLEDLQVLRNLRTLSATDWICSDTNLERLTDLVSLTSLELWTPNVYNLGSLSHLPRLKELRLHLKEDVIFSAIDAARFNDLTLLEVSLVPNSGLKDPESQSSIESFLCSMISSCPAPRRLVLPDLGLAKLPVYSLESSSHLADLTHLALAGNMLDEIPHSFRKLTALQELDISRNPIIFTKSSISQLAVLKRLKFIRVGFIESDDIRLQQWNGFQSCSVEQLRSALPNVSVQVCNHSLEDQTQRGDLPHAGSNQHDGSAHMQDYQNGHFFLL